MSDKPSVSATHQSSNMPASTLNLSLPEVVKAVLEFLEHQKLHVTQLSLEKETGLNTFKGNEYSAFLRQLIIDGQWDDVLEYLQPIEQSLKVDNFRRVRYAILRCKLLEMLCLRFELGEQVLPEKLISDCLEELKDTCESRQQYNELCFLISQLSRTGRLQDIDEYRSWTPPSARIECFRQVYELVRPVFEEFYAEDDENDDSNVSSPPKDSRLLCLLIKGLLYESAERLCVRIASSKQKLSLEDLDFVPFQSTDKTNSVENMSLLCWLLSLSPQCMRGDFREIPTPLYLEKLQKNQHQARLTTTRFWPIIMDPSSSAAATAATIGNNTGDATAAADTTIMMMGQTLNGNASMLHGNSRATMVKQMFSQMDNVREAICARPVAAAAPFLDAVPNNSRATNGVAAENNNHHHYNIDQNDTLLAASDAAGGNHYYKPHGHYGNGDAPPATKTLSPLAEHPLFLHQQNMLLYHNNTNDSIISNKYETSSLPDRHQFRANQHTRRSEMSYNINGNTSYNAILPPSHGGGGAVVRRADSLTAAKPVPPPRPSLLGQRPSQLALATNTNDFGSTAVAPRVFRSFNAHLPTANNIKAADTVASVAAGACENPNNINRNFTALLNDTLLARIDSLSLVRKASSDAAAVASSSVNGGASGDGATVYSEKSESNQTSVRTDTNNNNTKRSPFLPLTVLTDQCVLRCAAFHPNDGRFYAVGSNSHLLRICAVPQVTRHELEELENSIINGNSVTRRRDPVVVDQMPCLHNGSIYCTAWNRAGTILATGSNDKAVKVMRVLPARDDVLGDILTLSKPEVIATHPSTVRSVLFLDDARSNNSMLLSAGASASATSPADDSSPLMVLSDVDAAQPVITFRGHTKTINSVCRVGGGGSGQQFVSASEDRSVRLWDIRQENCTQVLNTQDITTELQPTSTAAGAATADDIVQPTSTTVFDSVFRATSLASGNNSGRSVLDSNLVFAGAKDGRCACWDVRSAHEPVFVCRPHSAEIRSLSYDVLTKSLLTAGFDGNVMLTSVTRAGNNINAALAARGVPVSIPVVQTADVKYVTVEWHPGAYNNAAASPALSARDVGGGGTLPPNSNGDQFLRFVTTSTAKECILWIANPQLVVL